MVWRLGVAGFGPSPSVARAMTATVAPTMTTTSTELTRSSSLPSAPSLVAVAPRPDRRTWLAGGALGLLAAVVLMAAVIPLPYVSILPGGTSPVSDLIAVRGAPSYPPEESVAYTTVSARQDVSLLQAIEGWLDDDIEVVPERELRGDRSAEENRRYNAELMSDSKMIATVVAMDRLGYDVIRTTGVVVRDLLNGSPAAGVLEIDDVIVAVDSEPVDVPDELTELLQEGGVGASHGLTVERPAGGGTWIDVRVSTIASDEATPRAVIGIGGQERFAMDPKLPFDVSIRIGEVGGPSAGLAFTLALLDVLTPGELTGDRRVAVTGTMALDGSVGPVGGGLQKAVAVRDAGYDAFLVPSDEFDVVRQEVGDDLDVIAVDTLEEALAALVAVGGTPIGPRGTTG